HWGIHEITTWSPGCRCSTPSPTSSITPAPSCPRTAGSGARSVPLRTERSEWHTPDAPSRTFTSLAFGAWRSTSTTSSGVSIALQTAALVISFPRFLLFLTGWLTVPLPPRLPLLALRGTDAVPEDDRDGQDHDGGDEGRDRQVHRDGGEVGRGGDDEAHDGHDQRRVPRPLAVANDAGDPGAAGEDGVRPVHHEAHPFVAKAASRRPGRSAEEKSRRATSRLASSKAWSGARSQAATSPGSSTLKTRTPAR